MIDQILHHVFQSLEQSVDSFKRNLERQQCRTNDLNIFGVRTVCSCASAMFSIVSEICSCQHLVLLNQQHVIVLLATSQKVHAQKLGFLTKFPCLGRRESWKKQCSLKILKHLLNLNWKQCTDCVAMELKASIGVSSTTSSNKTL